MKLRWWIIFHQARETESELERRSDGEPETSSIRVCLNLLEGDFIVKPAGY